MRFIDWIMILPEYLATRFDEAIFEYEKDTRMKYITSFERHGIKKGRVEASREAVADILRIRFEFVPDAIFEMINALDDLALLKQLHRKAVTVISLEEFVKLLEQHSVPA